MAKAVELGDAITLRKAQNGDDDALWAEVRRVMRETGETAAGAMKLLAKNGCGLPIPQAPRVVSVDSILQAIEQASERGTNRALAGRVVTQNGNGPERPTGRSRGGAEMISGNHT